MRPARLGQFCGVSVTKRFKMLKRRVSHVPSYPALRMPESGRGGEHAFYRIIFSSLILFLGLSSVWRYFFGIF